MNVRAELRRILSTRLGTDELQDLAFDLGLHVDEVPPDELVRDIIEWGERRQALGLLVEWIRSTRPDLGL